MAPGPARPAGGEPRPRRLALRGPAGAATFPLHIHYANEELLFVLAGRPTLRTLEGDRELSEGEVVALHAGRGGAHAVDNLSDEPVRFLVVSTRSPEINEFPERETFWVRDFAPGADAPATR